MEVNNHKPSFLEHSNFFMVKLFVWKFSLVVSFQQPYPTSGIIT